MSYWAKQHSSRQNIDNSILYTGNQTSTPSTAFGPQTYQIRVSTQVAGFLRIDGPAVVATASDMFIPTGVVEYFATAPGQFAAFISTSTSTGTFSLSEMT
jgi:hypothetical protein